MITTLEKCKEGDFVTLWCIGFNAWDNDLVKIVSKGILVTVQYRSGKKAEFINSTKCKTSTF